MGSSLSPIIANMVIEDLENSIIQSLGFELKIYLRYVDDIMIVAPNNKISFIQEKFNNYHERIKFTIEKINNNKLKFLDLDVIRVNNNIMLHARGIFKI